MDGLNKNQKIMSALVLQRDDACLQKEAEQRKAKRAKILEKKQEHTILAEKWAKREAKWADEIKFRKEMNF